jgi:carbon storage regulator
MEGRCAILVLSRRKNEALRIGKDGEITVMIVAIQGDKVRLGITAEKAIPVWRQEIYDIIQAKKQGSPHDAATPTAGSGGKGFPCKPMVRPVITGTLEP